MKTLYISDLDGTLLNKDKEIDKYTQQAVNDFIAKGGCFTVATARTAASAGKILAGLQLREPAVLMNGAVIYDFREEKYIKTEIIPMEAAFNILDTFEELGVSGFMYAIVNGKLVTYYENLETRALKDFYDERVQKYYKTFEQADHFRDRVNEKNIIYFTMIDEYDLLLDLYNRMKIQPGIDMVLYKDIYDEDLWYLEIYSLKASKYNAARFLREHGGYDRLIGFGDNHNDIPLLKACDEFYSVANAVGELKEMSSGIIATNVEQGVARFLSMQQKK